MRKPSVLVIFLTVFIDLIGFGIVVPLTPLFSRHFGAHGLLIGVIIASFSAMQFIFSPIWGRLSDRIGRRPVLLFSTAGAAGSYVLFALACGIENHTTAIWMMILSRMFAGICGGNITVAQAYIADITPPEKRSKRMGLIGMAFGLGFIFGPVLGGISLAGIKIGGFFVHGFHIPLILHFKGFGPTGPGWAAAVLCAANFLLALFILGESRKPSSEHVANRPRLTQWAHTFAQPKIGVLIMVFFFATFCFSCFESTLALLVADNFHLKLGGEGASAATITYLFAYCGIIGAFVQGGAIGRLVKKFGEPKLIAFSLVLTAVSLAMFPFISGTSQLSLTVLFTREGLPWVWELAALGLLAVGTSLTRPPLFGLLSNLTHEHEQGATIGVAQSAGSLARILGPIYATTLLHYSPAATYLICTAIMLGTAMLVAQRLFGEGRVVTTADTAKLPL